MHNPEIRRAHPVNQVYQQVYRVLSILVCFDRFGPQHPRRRRLRVTIPGHSGGFDMIFVARWQHVARNAWHSLAGPWSCGSHFLDIAKDYGLQGCIHARRGVRCSSHMAI